MDYCEPRKNNPFERYKFNRRVQEAGETYDQYRTALRKLAESCDFETIKAEEILRDRLVFGIRDNKVRERLLRGTKLTLEKTDEVCRASESMLAQMKVVGNNVAPLVPGVSAVNNQRKKHKPQEGRKNKPKHATSKECGSCGMNHDQTKREMCPAYHKTCGKCGKLSHFAAKCRSKKNADNRDNNAPQICPNCRR